MPVNRLLPRAADAHTYPSSAGKGPCCLRCPSSLASKGGSRTDHSTLLSSSAGVGACWWAAMAPLPGLAAPEAVLLPASWLSICCRPSLLSSSAGSCWRAPAPASHAGDPSLLAPLALAAAAAAAAAGRWRLASADTVRQRCRRPLRSDWSTHCGDTMPTPAVAGQTQVAGFPLSH